MSEQKTSGNSSNSSSLAKDRAELSSRKSGRRASIMAMFLVNIAMVLATFTPLSHFFLWFVDAWPERLDMMHGMLIVLWSGANLVGWWAAKMGD